MKLLNLIPKSLGRWPERLQATRKPRVARTARIAAGLILTAAWCATGALQAAAAEPVQPAPIVVSDFLCDKGLTRVGRDVVATLWCENAGETPLTITGRLDLPSPMRLAAGEDAETTVTLAPLAGREFRWRFTADAPGYDELVFTARAGDQRLARASHPMRFLPAIQQPAGDYIPPPVPAPTEILVGAHHCPLWEADRPEMWANILKHPERTPALGFYAQHDPEVADWETKWAVEHGISYFVYCWYRTSQGGPVETRFSSAIHDALFRSRYANQLRFTIMWENQRRGFAGVADEADLMENLLPYWLENYFQHPSYLKIDNKPVLFIYRPEFLVGDLGGVPQVNAAFDKMREACRRAGFDGLYLLGEYRGVDARHLQHMKQLGLDYTFAYVWPIPNHPTPQQASDAQLAAIRQTQQLGILPQVVTVSQAWSGWHDEGSLWKIPPAEFKTLLQRAKQFLAEQMRPDELGSRMLLLDNWNEWGEGHYIAPYREHGFGYLDAVREVFSQSDHRPQQLIPEDLGLGPYDRQYREWLAGQQTLRRQLRAAVPRPAGESAALVGWWSFDEEPESPVVLDRAGNRLGGQLHQAARAPGRRGQALVCDGGAVLVPHSGRLFPRQALTVACWVRSEQPGQDNNWIVNSVFGQGATGYRLGVLHGKPSFQVPETAWSHHLQGDQPLPVGRWVHLAGTFDGQTMRIYVDGVLRGSLERPGPVNAARGTPLVLGSYAQDHTAYFRGALDDVRLYDRALSPAEIEQLAAAGE